MTLVAILAAATLVLYARLARARADQLGAASATPVLSAPRSPP